MRAIAMLVMGALVLAGCTDPPTAERVLQQQNYRDIQITGYGWFGCSEDDTFATRFRARAPNGEMVTGVVCSGWLKGATVRIY